MRHIFIYSLLFFALPFSVKADANNLPYKRQDSEHIKEIFKAWDANKGEYLYNSMAALVMQEQQPERPSSVTKTPYELLESMSQDRIQRLDRIASQELANEKKARKTNQQYYWEEWLKILKSSECEASRGDSNGDPHLRTYDGESYDFQNAGDYLLTASTDNTFMIQTQQVRMNSSIALNGAVATNINGDRVELKSIEENNGRVVFVVNGEEIPESNADIFLPQGGIINYKNRKHIVKWPTGEQMSVGTRKFEGKQLYDLAIYVPQCKQDYYGLLGNNDGIKNDIVTVDRETGKTLSRENYTFSYEETFGVNRRNPKVMDQRNQDAHFITRVFSLDYQLDSTTSIFTNPLVDLSDTLRFPEEHLSLAELEDEQIKIALEKAREAGVAEEDLFGAIYDYGHLGLEPIAYNDDYQKTDRADIKEPELQKTGDFKNNTPQNAPPTPTVRVHPSIFIGTGVRVSPPIYRTPTPPSNRRDAGTTSPQGRRTPTTGTPTRVPR